MHDDLGKPDTRYRRARRAGVRRGLLGAVGAMLLAVGPASAMDAPALAANAQDGLRTHRPADSQRFDDGRPPGAFRAGVVPAAGGTIADDLFAPDDWAQRLYAFAKRQHGGGMGSRDYVYRLTDETLIDDLPGDARARGATSGMGIEIRGASDPFAIVFIVYMRFKDERLAKEYVDALDHNLNDMHQSIVQTFDISVEKLGSVTTRCVYVPDTENSIGCHFRAADPTIVVNVLMGKGPPIDLSTGKRAIELVSEYPGVSARIASANAAGMRFYEYALVK